MPRIYNESPFYERDNIIKNYYKLLAIPGRYAQASEFTEAQSVLLGCIKSIGDSLFKDGNVQTGCDIIVNGNTVTITEGRIYLDGVVRNSKETKLVITGTGTEIITARLEESLISESDDTSLLDPATDSSSAFQPGCFRVKQEIIFEVNGEGSTVAMIVDGKLQNYIVEKPQMDIINEVLARRTFAESGNYIVSGFNLKELDYPQEDALLVGLSKGQAFIKGYEVINPTDTTFTINKAFVTRDVIGEPKRCSRRENSFSLINNPLNEISRVFVTLTATDTIVYNYLVSEYELENQPVSEIISIDGYTRGVDYRLNNNRVVWLGQKTPSNGTNFTVNYAYKSLLTEGTDYLVYQGDVTTISITNEALLDNSEVLVDYSYYLARRDTVCLDAMGSAVVVKGIDDDLDECFAPKVHDDAYLPLGEILIYPNSTKYEIINDTVRVSTMQRIQNAIERLDKLEYNVMMTTLDRELYDQESSEQLRAMFTESFVNYDRVDFTVEGVRLSFDIFEGKMYPYFEDTRHDLLLSSNPNNRYGIIGDVYTLPYTSRNILSQLNTTGTMLVNPYQAFDPIMSIEISPSIDTWVNTVKRTQTQTRTVYRNYMWMSQMRAAGVRDGQTTNQTTSVTSKVLSDSESTYMRQREVKVTSKTFPNSANNVRCLFDGRLVPLTPLNTTTRGNTSGSVRPDIEGNLEASFTVPANVPCGTVEVKLFDGNLEGSAQYRATGRDRVVQETILITQTVHRYVDPLAQTFVLNDTRILTGIDLYFANKDSHSATVQIRNVEVGMPGKLIYSEAVVRAKDIKTSTNGTAVTHVKFPNVVRCEKDTEYCVVVLTDSPKLSMFIAKLGDKTLDGSKYITSNPYTTGVLLSSSNASTWTPHQDMDLKFAIYGAVFESKGELNFSKVTINSADRLMYTIDILNSISSQAVVYSNVNDTGFNLVEPWQSYELETHAKSCNVRIAMSTMDSNQSPMINKDSLGIISFISENSARYISKNTILETECQEFKILLNTSSHPDNTIKVWYATDGIGQAWNEVTVSKTRTVDVRTKQLEFFKDGLTIKNFRIKVEISTTNTCSRPFISKLGVIFNESL